MICRYPTWLAVAMDFARSFEGAASVARPNGLATSPISHGKPKETDPLRWQAWSLFNDENPSQRTDFPS